MDNRPHYVWAFVVIAIFGVAAWIYSSNRANTETYEKGSTHPESTYHNSPFSISIGQGGCATIGEMMKRKQEAKNDKSNKTVANSAAK